MSRTPITTVDDALNRAARASDPWSRTNRADRARALECIASALDADADELVAAAHAETHLGPTRLSTELGRTTFQLRLFAETVAAGEYLDAHIDPPDASWIPAPRPDLRRQLEPVGAVLVFTASNFPFAFGVPGGDTASALAAGCPVVVKGHSGHVVLSERIAQTVSHALDAAGAPDGVFSHILGTDSGREAIRDPRIRAASFTGSISGGRALFDLATSRPDPIPFFGELGSVNPVFVTRAAAKLRAADIAAGFIESFTHSAGQLCTKPGVIFVPQESELIALLRSAALPPGSALLNERIRSGYTRAVDALDQKLVLRRGEGSELTPAPTLFSVSMAELLADFDELTEERFGPTSLVVGYDCEEDLLRAATQFPGQLTGSIHGEEDEAIAARLIDVLRRRSGRIVWNQWPTGVAVTRAQVHGGPYPATTSPGFTSVGTNAITRFLRPVAYQGVPQALLPAELRDGSPVATREERSRRSTKTPSVAH